jgi:hypothetical protein
MARNRHTHTPALNPDFVGYIQELEQLADRLESALVGVLPLLTGSPANAPVLIEAASALGEADRVRQTARGVYSAA